jgi:hypothetical protein
MPLFSEAHPLTSIPLGLGTWTYPFLTTMNYPIPQNPMHLSPVCTSLLFQRNACLVVGITVVSFCF